MHHPNLAPGHVELWYTYIDRTVTQRLRACYCELLRGEELERAARLKLPRVRNEYLVARALVRHVLSHYASVPAEAWTFTQNAHGKPVVATPWPGFTSFNLSHSAGLVVLAVAASGQIGVDVESLQRKTTGIDLARRFFSAPEVLLLESCPEYRQHEMFLQIWTLKEAFIKAIGQGLSFPLDQFSMSLPKDGPPRIRFAAADGRPPESGSRHWQFAQIRFLSEHHLSLAVSLPHAAELVVTGREVVPQADATLADDAIRPLICQRANAWYARQK